ncbi:hypothetical protein BN59_02209 [Legionella massiliensis]|uniref:Uncharacterized protein n=1 Tax=Legionella massiliensis TaxID=1034943 RepID=A0A078KU18_9GAMM|nr:hypothetical protein [Legionella massiliensis]CDZ77915.1 hypothetical protein BN59_02209 [Legionella massiliensis]CEE13653.1 hypothetical protein BN1094_02209 [Legionella massiliensis]
MVEEQNTQSAKFISVVDQELRESIIRLDQKLKGLNAEIAAKIESLETIGGKREQIQALTRASEDVSQAIKSIHDLITSEVSEGVTDAQFQEANRTSINYLKEAFASQLAAITELKEKL